MQAKVFYMVAKPGIIMGNLITAAGGFALASRGHFDLNLFSLTLIGLALVIASASVFNNYIDRNADAMMGRTKNRPLVTGSIAIPQAILFAISLGLLGMFLLLFVNLLTAFIALFGFLVYVLLYSFSKYHTVNATLIGSISGAVPPVVGYCAASNHFDLAALILFCLIALWQMPHFFAIAIYRFDDYSAASIPVLPVKRGISLTKIQMLLYIIAFAITASMLTLFHYTGTLFLITATLFSAAWFILCLKGFKSTNDKLWARQMFLFSLVVVVALCAAIPLSI